MVIKKLAEGYLLRLERGEKIIEQLQKFCEMSSVRGGFFVGLGAVDEVELAHYDVETQTYSRSVFQEPFEVTNLVGSVGLADQLIIHAHISLGRKDMSMLGGHLMEAKVSGTMEIWLTTSEQSWMKIKDPVTGLWVFGE